MFLVFFSFWRDVTAIARFSAMRLLSVRLFRALVSCGSTASNCFFLSLRFHPRAYFLMPNQHLTSHVFNIANVVGGGTAGATIRVSPSPGLARLVPCVGMSSLPLPISE